MNRVIDAANALVVEWEQDVFTPSGTPEQFTATVQDDFEVTMTYDSDDLVSVSITGDIDVSRINLPLWDRRARLLVTHSKENGQWRLAPPKLADIAQRAPSPRSSQYTPDFLEQVAEAFARNGYQGVQDEFEVGRRQASRYISRARDAGMIER